MHYATLAAIGSVTESPESALGATFQIGACMVGVLLLATIIGASTVAIEHTDALAEERRQSLSRMRAYMVHRTPALLKP